MAGSNPRSAPDRPRLVRVEPDATVGLATARAGDDVRPLGHLVLEPPDIGVLRRELEQPQRRGIGGWRPRGRGGGRTEIINALSHAWVDGHALAAFRRKPKS